MKIKNFAVALLAFSTLSSTAFSMDHAEMKLARNTAHARQIGNDALRDRDAARLGGAGANYLAAKATAGGPLQAYLDAAVADAAARINAVLDGILAAEGRLVDMGAHGNAANGANIALASNMFGPNGGRTAIAAPAGDTKAQLKAGLLAAMRDQNTMAELAHHSAQVIAVPGAARDSQIFSIVDGVNTVLSQKVAVYIQGLRADNAAPIMLAADAADRGADVTRDGLRDELRDAVLAW